MSAEIIRLCDHRLKIVPELDVDLHTAVDVAIRDLQEVGANWGTPRGLERLIECREMLLTVLAAS